jgi:hypothetical protein
VCECEWHSPLSLSKDRKKTPTTNIYITAPESKKSSDVVLVNGNSYDVYDGNGASYANVVYPQTHTHTNGEITHKSAQRHKSRTGEKKKKTTHHYQVVLEIEPNAEWWPDKEDKTNPLAVFDPLDYPSVKINNVKQGSGHFKPKQR